MPDFSKKETLARVFSCEFCEISNKIFFYRTPPVAPSINSTTRRQYLSILSGEGYGMGLGMWMDMDGLGVGVGNMIIDAFRYSWRLENF